MGEARPPTGVMYKVRGFIKMICMVTDVWEGEPDILRPVKREPLKVYCLGGSLIETIPAPAGGWTHERLECQAKELTPKTRGGADAFLGEQWVGGTEV